MIVTRCRADSRWCEWCRAGRIIGLVLALLATGLPFVHAHAAREASLYDQECPDARLAIGAPGTPLLDRSDDVTLLVWRVADVRPLAAEPPFRPLPHPAWRAPPA